MERLDHEFPRIAESFEYLQRLFIDAVCPEILRHRTVVVVLQAIIIAIFNFLRFVGRTHMEKIFNIEDVDVSNLVHWVSLLLGQ